MVNPNSHRARTTRIVKQAVRTKDMKGRIINALNFNRLKNQELARIAGQLGVSKNFLMAGTVGLAIYLAASALNSKKQVQGGG